MANLACIALSLDFGFDFVNGFMPSVDCTLSKVLMLCDFVIFKAELNFILACQTC